MVPILGASSTTGKQLWSIQNLGAATWGAVRNAMTWGHTEKVSENLSPGLERAEVRLGR